VLAGTRWCSATSTRDPDLTVPELARRMCKQLSDPALWPLQKLFLEVYAQAL
jgi:hypothetical protein